MTTQNSPMDSTIQLLKHISSLIDTTVKQDQAVINKALKSISIATNAKDVEIWAIIPENNSYFCQFKISSGADRKQNIDFNSIFQKNLSKIVSKKLECLPLDNTDTIFPFIRHTEFLGFGLLRERSIQSFSQDDCTILSEIFRIVIGAYFQINKQETDFSKEIFDQQQAHRDKILRTTNDVTNIFNSEISFEQRMNEALRVVGESVGVDRVYVYQNVREENGGCFVEQIFLWESANVPPKNRSDRFISAEEIAIKKQPDQRFKC